MENTFTVLTQNNPRISGLVQFKRVLFKVNCITSCNSTDNSHKYNAESIDARQEYMLHDSTDTKLKKKQNYAVQS